MVLAHLQTATIVCYITERKQAATSNDKQTPFHIDSDLTGRNIYLLVVMKAAKTSLDYKGLKAIIKVLVGTTK